MVISGYIMRPANGEQWVFCELKIIFKFSLKVMAMMGKFVLSVKTGNNARK